MKTFGELTKAEALLEFEGLTDVSFAEALNQIDGQEEKTLISLFPEREFVWLGVSRGFFDESADYGTVLQDASQIDPDETLRNANINIKLDRFSVKNYPGNGTHEILIKFTAKHHVVASSDIENIAFTRKFTVRDNGDAGIAGQPFFMGIKVPSAGIGLDFEVVYLKNETASRFLDFLDSPVMNQGLQMITVANPALKPLTEMATGLVTSIARRNDGRRIHSGYVGLDFSGAIKLRTGTYVIAQTPTDQIDWSVWKHTASGIKNSSGELLPYNHFFIRVEKFVAEEGV